MAEKLHGYVGYLGWFHEIRENIRDKIALWKEQNPDGITGLVKRLLTSGNQNVSGNVVYEDYSHIYRAKTRKEMIRVSAAVMGIEFSYAAETAFVSPTLLKIGVEHKHMTLVWALSPLIGFFLTPILGSLSDRCPLKFGRRRPFIIILSLGVLLGLVLVPNGEKLGLILGDSQAEENFTSSIIGAHRTSVSSVSTNFSSGIDDSNTGSNLHHPWGIFFTVLGTVLLDFDADACQSPARAYLLDVTIPEDHARGLSTFTIMAGLGGFFGYAMGGLNWDATYIGVLLGGHVKAVFTIITIIFVICVTYTVTSFREVPLHVLEVRSKVEQHEEDTSECQENRSIFLGADLNQYGSMNDCDGEEQDASSNIHERRKLKLQRSTSITPTPNASLTLYLRSIIFMPQSVRILCVTNLFCWMAHVCYSLYFTDFVGEAVFNGIPTAPIGSAERELYESGVRYGCWGMSMYSLSCACYSMMIETIIQRFGAKKVYVTGLLIYASGMCLMAVTKDKVGVILFSWTAGVMYSTLFTMPYLLVAHYHAKGIFELTADGEAKGIGQIRGLGTDVAIVSSMVFLAQFILSICMGTIVSISHTTTAVVSVASMLALCGAISATRVMYLDL